MGEASVWESNCQVHRAYTSNITEEAKDQPWYFVSHDLLLRWAPTRTYGRGVGEFAQDALVRWLVDEADRPRPVST